MKNDDVQLIHRILDGDDTAFTELVEKYQKSVHALAWRKIGDFHIAEEITQDTFLKAYQKLGTLKKPQRFASWLYVIASRRCVAWARKKRVWTQPLEETSSLQVEKSTYSQYVIEENERTAAEAQREVVKKLLAKLPESERTVITLHYFGDMSSAEIGAFLGVSANTIRSRLRRAQHRLQKEETMIREALDHFQISPNLTDNIMREVARLKPTAPSGSKPLMPWVAAASSAILIILMLGIGSQRLVRFQKPYSLDAKAETTVELVDASVVLNLEAKPNVQDRLGNPNIVGKSNNGQKPDEVLLAASQTEGEDKVSVPKQQWTQTGAIKGSFVDSLLATSESELYVYANGHLYKLPTDGTGWQHVNDFSSLIDIWHVNRPLMAEWNNTLYIVLINKLYASNDDGKTWNVVHSWREDKYWSHRELFLTEKTFYLTFNNGIMGSEDQGKTWKDISDEFPNIPYFFVTIQDTVFAVIGSGLYRRNGDNWQRLELPGPEKLSIVSVAGTKDRLYVIGFLAHDGLIPDLDIISKAQKRTWWIFRSTDLGNSWNDITPTNAWSLKGFPPDKIVAAGETLLVMERGMVRSTDGGDTWMPSQLPGTSPSIQFSVSDNVALNEHIFYINSWEDGLTRSIDGGKTWEGVNITPDQEKDAVFNLIVDKGSNEGQNTTPTLYARVYTREATEIVKTMDAGKSWQVVQVEIPLTDPYRVPPSKIDQIVKSGDILYAKGGGDHTNRKLRLYRISADGSMLDPIQGMPTFDSTHLFHLLHLGAASRGSDKSYTEKLQKSSAGATQFFKQLAQMKQQQAEIFYKFGLQGAFAVSDDTYYMEYNFKLFRWEPGDTEWYDTGLEETFELTSDIARRKLKLAASGDTVYVGKRDGHLVVSFDRGNNWIDLTPGLPFPIKTFREILVAESTVYVATDIGIITSDDGRSWHTIADADGTNLIMEHLAADGTTVYGVTKNTGIYRLENDIWAQVVSEIPESVTSLAVDGNTLYVGTQNRGMLYFTLDE